MQKRRMMKDKVMHFLYSNLMLFVTKENQNANKSPRLDKICAKFVATYIDFPL